MPIPKPKKDESQDDFISRCMGDEVMKNDYPDNDQRLAVCFSSWKKKDKKSLLLPEGMERRFLAAAEIRIDDADGPAIKGYAAVFNKWSDDLGFFKEQIKPGAFSKTIKEQDVRALINHDPNLIIGRTKNKTLKLWEDDEGLGFEVKLPDTSYAKDLAESIRRKDITQNSFGFQMVQDEWSSDQKKRTLLEVRLFDISPVTFPAYKQTTVSMRLHDMGIDYEALNMAMIRADQGIITDLDVDLFHATIGILNRYVPIKLEPLIVVPAAPEHFGDRTEPLIVAPAAPEHSEPSAEMDLVSTLIRARIMHMASNKLLRQR